MRNNTQFPFLSCPVRQSRTEVSAWTAPTRSARRSVAAMVPGAITMAFSWFRIIFGQARTSSGSQLTHEPQTASAAGPRPRPYSRANLPDWSGTMQQLIEAARLKKLDRIAVGYTVGAWAVVHATSIAAPVYFWPQWILPSVITGG